MFTLTKNINLFCKRYNPNEEEDIPYYLTILLSHSFKQNQALICTSNQEFEVKDFVTHIELQNTTITDYLPEFF